MHVILMGAQGAGKGTQAGRIAPRFRLEHLSTGELFRAEIASESDLGSLAASFLDRGELVPDDVTIGIVETRLDVIAANRTAGTEPVGALFDGFPRTEGQAKALDWALERRSESIALVIELSVPRPLLVERLAGRRLCPICGTVYNALTQPPSQAGLCDREGAELIQRADDTPEAIERRLAVYFAQTEPLLSYYRDRGLVTTINGNQPVDMVTEAISVAISSALPVR